MKITVIGCGHLGATHAACLAELGHHVLGMDTCLDKVRLLNSGRAPFFEPGLDGLIAKHLATGRLSFTASYAEAAHFADTHFLAVGTPQLPGEDAYDVAQLFRAAQQLAVLIDRPALIVGKSTVPVGTAARITELVQALSPAGDSVRVAWKPEFLRKSFAIGDTLYPDRIVVGLPAGGELAESVLREVYARALGRGTPFIVTDLATAELVKTAANAFLATKISFINAMAELCEATGADVEHLASALSHDDRIGRGSLQPGLGFGGGCLPKDVRGFSARAAELGADQTLTFLRQVDAINNRRRSRVIDLAREECQGVLDGKRVAVWGAAYKPNTDDVRDSPALDVACNLHRLGAKVTVHDPMALDNARKAFPQLDYAGDALHALDGADLLLHLTEWPEFTRLDPGELRTRVQRPSVIDGRGTLNRKRWSAAGWNFRTLGGNRARLLGRAGV